MFAVKKLDIRQTKEEWYHIECSNLAVFIFTLYDTETSGFHAAFNGAELIKVIAFSCNYNNNASYRAGRLPTFCSFYCSFSARPKSRYGTGSIKIRQIMLCRAVVHVVE